MLDIALILVIFKCDFARISALKVDDVGRRSRRKRWAT